MTINREASTYIEGTVHADHDFVARDKHITYETTVIVQSPEDVHQAVAEQARQAALLAGTFARLPFEPECVMIPAEKTASPDFYMGKYPVTNAQYGAYFSANPTAPAPRRAGWHLNNPPADKVDHPVVGVSQDEAIAYCRWLSEITGRSYRLPSHAEWARVARGPAGYRYPWGDEWQEQSANVAGQGTASVTAHPDGASAYGCQDMLGNVQEWTATEATRGEYVHCGGSYRDMAQVLHCGFYDSSPGDAKVEWRGFRLLLEIV